MKVLVTIEVLFCLSYVLSLIANQAITYVPTKVKERIQDWKYISLAGAATIFAAVLIVWLWQG